MKRCARAVIILLAVLVVGSAAGWGQAPEAKSLPNWYKIDVTWNEFESGKKVNSRSYTLSAKDTGDRAEMRLGDRVPIATGVFNLDKPEGISTQFQYVDVGTNIYCRLRDQGQNRLELSIEATQSSVRGSADFQLPGARTAQTQPVIRQLGTTNTVYIVPGKPVVVATVDDPGAANRKVTIEATVTKVNP